MDNNEAQTHNVGFETDFTDQISFIAIWYSVKNSDLLSSNWFFFQGTKHYVLKILYMCFLESERASFSPI
jgi:hypothetical protein